MPTQKTAFLSDIHGNSPALEAVLTDIHAQSCVRVFVLGDIINGVDPHESLDLLRCWATRLGIDLMAIKGNAEEYILTPDMDEFPLAKESFYPELLRLLKWWLAHLTPDDLAWLRSLPEVIIWNDALLVHDSPFVRLESPAVPGIDPRYAAIMNHHESIMPDIQGEDLQRLLHLLRSRGLRSSFSGHSHVPFIRQVGLNQICNVGSVGMPLDGDWRPSWVLQDGGSLELRRVEYDLQRTFMLIDSSPDDPQFEVPGTADIYKQGLAAGLHRKFFIERKR